MRITLLPLYLLFIAGTAFASSICDQAEHVFQPWELNLNRTAVQIETPPRPSSFAFQWNQGDNQTDRWRPQGISSYRHGSTHLILVSWYSREEQDRGARVSVVDITDRESIRYRHILLVDAECDPLRSVHAGGLAVIDDTLFVAGRGRNILTYDLNRILEVPEDHREEFFNYRYLLAEQARFSAPVKTSFLSADPARQRLLTGNFYKCEAVSNRHNDEQCEQEAADSTELYWLRLSRDHDSVVDVQALGNSLTEMQGAAYDGERLWISASYGRNHDSHLHLIEMNRQPRRTHQQETIFILPAGLEDLHFDISENGTMWSLTEFGPHEGRHNRMVLSFPKAQVSPRGQTHPTERTRPLD